MNTYRDFRIEVSLDGDFIVYVGADAVAYFQATALLKALAMGVNLTPFSRERLLCFLHWIDQDE